MVLGMQKTIESDEVSALRWLPTSGFPVWDGTRWELWDGHLCVGDVVQYSPRGAYCWHAYSQNGRLGPCLRGTARTIRAAAVELLGTVRQWP